MYYCANCEKEVAVSESIIPFPSLEECPECEDSEGLFGLEKESTDLLKGKIIDKIFANVWENNMNLVTFTDGTKATIENVESDEIEIRLVGYDYED